MEKYKDVLSVVADRKPEGPMHVFRPHALEKATKFFLKNFDGECLYAVKTNPDAHIISSLTKLGVKSFDVASLEEIKTVRRISSKAELYFMHTVKSREAIKRAYHDFNVRNFSLDSYEELKKIMKETGQAKDLNLFVRLSIPNTYAELNLSDKFGVNLNDAVELLRDTRKKAKRLGVCFHVGSQCMHSDAYRIAMRIANKIIRKSRVKVDAIDVGGGFPSIYPGMIPPPMETYIDAIHEEFADMKKGKDCKLLCEPGRALVAESGSVIVRVDLRRGEFLYINDGTYGSLFDAGFPKFIYPVKLLRPSGESSSSVNPYSFFGPTCDTMDFMKGPFYLPDDVEEGDYIEIGQLGAYGRTLATGFNGFKPEKEIVAVVDDPLMTMYDGDHKISDALEVVAA